MSEPLDAEFLSVTQAKGLSTTVKLVGLRLLYVRDKTPDGWLDEAAMAVSMQSRSRRTVRKALDALVERGLAECELRGKRRFHRFRRAGGAP